MRIGGHGVSGIDIAVIGMICLNSLLARAPASTVDCPRIRLLRMHAYKAEETKMRGNSATPDVVLF